jgi:hypothetical protein
LRCFFVLFWLLYAGGPPAFERYQRCAEPDQPHIAHSIPNAAAKSRAKHVPDLPPNHDEWAHMHHLCDYDKQCDTTSNKDEPGVYSDPPQAPTIK